MPANMVCATTTMLQRIAVMMIVTTAARPRHAPIGVPMTNRKQNVPNSQGIIYSTSSAISAAVFSIFCAFVSPRSSALSDR